MPAILSSLRKVCQVSTFAAEKCRPQRQAGKKCSAKKQKATKRNRGEGTFNASRPQKKYNSTKRIFLNFRERNVGRAENFRFMNHTFSTRPALASSRFIFTSEGLTRAAKRVGQNAGFHVELAETKIDQPDVTLRVQHDILGF